MCDQKRDNRLDEPLFYLVWTKSVRFREWLKYIWREYYISLI